MTKQFYAGTRFEDIVALYEFDRELRLLCLDAVERIEVALRAAIVEQIAVPHGAHFYLNPGQFGTVESFCGFFSKGVQARYLAISYYHQQYGQPSTPPIWALLEGVTFGTLSHLYSGLERRNRRAVATAFGFDETVLVSWFRTVNDLRNACAHHNRLWDKSMLVNQPVRARVVAAELATVGQQRFYGRAVVLASLLDDQLSITWKEQLKALFDRFPSVSVAKMGFPADWRTRAFWV